MKQDIPSYCFAPPDEGAQAPLPECLIRYTGFLIAKVHQRLWVQFQHVFQKYGIDGPAVGILTLLLELGSMSQQQLGRHLRVDRTTMVKLVDALEKQGLACRKDHPDDRRVYLVEITEKGRDCAQRVQKEGEAMERALLAQFSEDERKTIRRALVTLAG